MFEIFSISNIITEKENSYETISKVNSTSNCNTYSSIRKQQRQQWINAKSKLKQTPVLSVATYLQKKLGIFND